MDFHHGKTDENFEDRGRWRLANVSLACLKDWRDQCAGQWCLHERGHYLHRYVRHIAVSSDHSRCGQSFQINCSVRIDERDVLGFILFLFFGKTKVIGVLLGGVTRSSSITFSWTIIDCPQLSFHRFKPDCTSPSLFYCKSVRAICFRELNWLLCLVGVVVALILDYRNATLSQYTGGTRFMIFMLETANTRFGGKRHFSPRTRQCYLSLSTQVMPLLI